MVVLVGLTDKPFPVPAKVPPHETVYHLIVAPVPPPPPLSVRVVLPPLQMVVEAAVADVGAVDAGFNVTVAALLLLVHPVVEFVTVKP